MTGHILDYSIQTNTGAISGDDGNRYSFTGADWRESGAPQVGMRVDFDPNGSAATGIYGEARVGAAAGAAPAAAPAAALGAKSKTTAGVLAILLGGLGVHKFYLGYTGIGLLHITFWFLTFFISCTLGCVIGIFTFGIGGIFAILVIWAIYWALPVIEGIIYLTKSDEEFHRIYVDNSRVFF